jgi:excisionase family DNA binding protein
MIMAESDILTAAEVAEYLRLGVATIYRMARQGEIPAVRVGRSWRFSRGLLAAWIDEQMAANLNGDDHVAAESGRQGSV